MTSSYHGINISGSQLSFLTEMVIALSNNQRKVWATVLFVSVIMQRNVIHVNFFLFFLPYLQDHSLL